MTKGGEYILNKTDEFKIKVYELTNGEYEVLGEYINCDTPIKFKHKLCGNEWDTTTPYSFTRKNKPTRCPKCAYRNNGNNALLSEIDFLDKITDINKKKFRIIGKYTKGENPIEIQCKNCENIFDSKANILTNKNKSVRCPICEKSHPRKDTKWFKNKVKLLVQDEYEVLGEYTGSEDNILMKHNICGYEWDTTIPTSFLRGTRCPYCKSSKAEKIVFDFLTRNNIEFESQKIYDDLKGYKKFLPYDFYIIEQDILIECQGQFHDETAKIQSKEELRKRQLNDKKKKEYAQSHNIELLEIWYWDFDNIEEILKNKLNLKENDINV